MKKITLLLIVVCLVALQAQQLPQYLEITSKARQSEGILYAGENFNVTVNSVKLKATAVRENNLYAARFLNGKIAEKLKQYGDVLYMSPEKTEAIMRVNDMDSADRLASLLHDESEVSGCGALIRLMDAQETLVPMSSSAQKSITDTIARVKNLRNSDGSIKKMTDMVNSSNIRQFVEALSAYPDRYHRSSNGKAAADFIFDTFKSFASSNNNLTVEKFNHNGTPQPSIIAKLKGTTNPDEIVIVGCHIDSINRWGDAPGADDNASGTATVKEVLRIMSTYGYKFKRTIEFHGYAGEEGGLIGSGEVAARYKSQGKKVIGMIQVDMDLYVSSGATPKICLVSNDTTGAHNDMAVKFIESYCNISWKTGPLWAGTSDHRSWTRRGYPAIFPFEDVSAHNRNIHTSSDTIANSGRFDFAANFAKLTITYLATIAEIDE